MVRTRARPAPCTFGDRQKACFVLNLGKRPPALPKISPPLERCGWRKPGGPNWSTALKNRAMSSLPNPVGDSNA